MRYSRSVMRSLLAVVLVLGLSLPAFADKKHKWTESEQQSIALIKRAVRQYDLGKYDEAILLLEQAYDEHQFPESLH